MASAARPPGSKSSRAWLLDSSRVRVGQLEQRWWAAFSSLAKIHTERDGLWSPSQRSAFAAVS